MPKKDTPAKKTRKKPTKAKAKGKAEGVRARASVVSNIQNKIVIGDLGGSKKSARRRAPNKPKQPQFPVASYSSPYMTFGAPSQYNDDLKNDLQKIKNLLEEPTTATPPLLKEPPTRPLLEAPPTRPLLEAPLPPTLLKAPPTPSEPEEVPPQSTDLAIREPRSTDIGTDLAIREPRTDSSIYSNTLTNYYPPKPKKSALLNEWVSYENPLPFSNEEIPADTSTFEDVTTPPTIRPGRGRPKADERVRYLRKKANAVDFQIDKAKKESTKERLREKKQNYEDEIASLVNMPVSLSAKIAPNIEYERDEMGMEDYDAGAMFSKPLVSEPSPLAKPLVARSSSAKKPLIYKGKTPQKEDDDEGIIITPENLKTPDDEGAQFYSPSLGDVYSTVSSAVSSSVIKPLIDTGSNLLKSYNPMMSMPKMNLVEDGATEKRDLVNISTTTESDDFDKFIKELEKDKQLFNKKRDIFERGTGDPDEEEVDKRNAEFYMYLINSKVNDFLNEARMNNPEKYSDYIAELSSRGLLNISVGKSNRFQAPLKGGRQGASMRRKEEWDALPDGTQLELTYNKSNRIYTKQGDGVVDAEGNQYKSLNDVVRKYKASIGDTKGFGSAYGMFKILEPVESKSPVGKVTKVKVTKVTKMPNP